MQGWKWKSLFQYSIILASLFILVFFSLDWQIRLLLGIVLVGCIIWCQRTATHNESQRNRAAWGQQRVEDEKMFVKMMNVARHNWLNEIQVLYAYIQLKKYDQLHGELEKINQKLLKESYISRLGYYPLVAFIYHFRLVHWKETQLEVEMEQTIELGELPCRGDKIAELILRLLRALTTSARVVNDEVNRLQCAIRADDDGILIELVYRGIIDMIAAREMISAQLLEAALDVEPVQQQYEHNYIHIIIRAPFMSSL